MDQRSYAIIGVGGIGGYYGGLLARSGLDVRFLMRDSAERVRREGLRVESPRGDFHVNDVQAFDDPSDVPLSDVAVVALKTTQNTELGEILPQVVKPDGVVVVLQNGYGMEQLVATAAPGRTIIGGACFVCSRKLGPGHIQHQDYGLIDFAQHTPDGQPAGATPLLKSIVDDFDRATIPVKLSEDLLAVRWTKLIWNVPYNGLTVLHDTTTDKLMAALETRTHIERIMHEIVDCGGANRRPIDRAVIRR